MEKKNIKYMFILWFHVKFKKAYKIKPEQTTLRYEISSLITGVEWVHCLSLFPLILGKM